MIIKISSFENWSKKLFESKNKGVMRSSFIPPRPLYFKFNPYPWIFGDHPRACFLEKKNPESSLVTSQLGLRKWKLYVLIQCQLGYLMILISNGICQYEGKYAVLNKNICHFLDHHRAWFSEKKSTAEKHIQIDSMLRSGFFSPQNTLGDGPAFWIS